MHPNPGIEVTAIGLTTFGGLLADPRGTMGDDRLSATGSKEYPLESRPDQLVGSNFTYARTTPQKYQGRIPRLTHRTCGRIRRDPWPSANRGNAFMPNQAFNTSSIFLNPNR